MFQHGITIKEVEEKVDPQRTISGDNADQWKYTKANVKRRSVSHKILNPRALSTVIERKLSNSDSALNVSTKDSNSNTENSKDGIQKDNNKVVKMISRIWKPKRRSESLLAKAFSLDKEDGHNKTGDDTSAALRYAVRGKFDLGKVVELLSNEQTDVNGCGANGITALHEAAIDGNLECMRILVTNGASVDACDCEGFTPLDYATFGGNFECAAFLIEKGATEDRIKDGQILCKEATRRKNRSATFS